MYVHACGHGSWQANPHRREGGTPQRLRAFNSARHGVPRPNLLGREPRVSTVTRTRRQTEALPRNPPKLVPRLRLSRTHPPPLLLRTPPNPFPLHLMRLANKSPQVCRSLFSLGAYSNRESQKEAPSTAGHSRHARFSGLKPRRGIDWPCSKPFVFRILIATATKQESCAVGCG